MAPRPQPERLRRASQTARPRRRRGALLSAPPLACSAAHLQVPDRNFFLAVDNDADRNEWVAAIGRATTENRRVRSYSEEVEYQEQQARAAPLDSPDLITQ